MRKSYTVDGHTIEFWQGSSTLDPWCSEYCREINLSIMCTSDITPYMMIDGEKIYHLRRHHHKYFDLIDALESDVVVVTWEDITTLWEDLFDDFAGNFSELKKSYDRMKKNADINGAIGILRKGNAISDDQIKILRDRGDIVSPKVLNINP